MLISAILKICNDFLFVKSGDCWVRIKILKPVNLTSLMRYVCLIIVVFL
jgi:hypothetical protein